MKVMLGFIALVVALGVNAKDAPTTMKVSSQINASCYFSVKDFVFGEIQNNAVKVENFSFRCTKDTSMKMYVSGITNPSSYGAQFMTIDGVQVPQNGSDTATTAIGKGIRYAIVTGFIPNSTADFTMVHRPYTDGLIKDFGGVYDHTMTIKATSGNSFDLQMGAKIMDFEENRYRFKQGNYFDILTLNISY